MEITLSTLEIKNSFLRQGDIENVVFRIKSKMQMEISTCETNAEKKKVFKEYRQKIYSKLTTIFRRQVMLSVEEAIKFYSNNDDVLQERIEIYYNILDTINDDLDVVFIPDRLYTCAFFRISADTYSAILNDPRADISTSLKRNFENIEEYIISLTTNGIENGVLNGYAWKKMQLKSKFGGNEIKSVETNPFHNGQLVIEGTGKEAQQRLETNYNFPELEIKENKN